MRSVPINSNAALLRSLPSIDELLRSPDLAAALAQSGHEAVTAAARAVLARLRAEVTQHALDAAEFHEAIAGLVDAALRELRRQEQYSLQPVINATGVILHTNLGRAPLSQAALDHAREIATQYSNLEFDIASGERGKRDVHVQRQFERLFQAPAGQAARSTIVVNNNAAAVLLVLNSLAEGGEVIVSRGELVEIGGSFRVPEIMAKSGAVLREVGATNRTRISDYQAAITERTRLLLRVHRSNFQITGFTSQPSLEELAALAHRHDLPLAEDLGSGALFDLRAFGMEGEPGIAESLAAGVDVLMCSGDKLLGGPQAGIITGRADLIARTQANPLFRALRVDKLTYATLEATLLACLRQDHGAIPILRMMALQPAELRARAQALAETLAPLAPGIACEVVEVESVIGGGAAPAAALPSIALAVAAEGHSVDDLAARLRHGTPPIIARVEQGRLLLDLRTVFPAQDAAIVEAIRHLAL